MSASASQQDQTDYAVGTARDRAAANRVYVGSLVKSGAGTLVLSGQNTYTGGTTVSEGTLQFAKAASLYNGNTTLWTAANLTVASGATAAFNVGGSNEFTSGNLDTLVALTGMTLATLTDVAQREQLL